MKTIITVFLVMTAITTNAQVPAIGSFSAGISSKHSAVVEVALGLKISDKVNIYPATWKIHSQASNPSIPVIIEPRIAYNIASFELYSGAAWHFAGQDNKAMYKKYSGLKLGAGIIHHFRKNLIASGSVSGNVFTFMVGIWGFK